MRVESIKKQDAVLVTVTGRMDAVAAPDFERACDAWIDKGEKHLVVDATGLEYISSMGLRCFLVIAKKLQQSGGRLALCGLGGVVREVFKISGVLPLFAVFDTPEAAIGAIGS